MEVNFTKTEGGGRWEIQLDKENVAFMKFVEVGGGVIDINSTVVPTQYSGQGIARKLMENAVQYLRENHLKTSPSCSYVQVQLERYPEWQDVRL